MANRDIETAADQAQGMHLVTGVTAEVAFGVTKKNTDPAEPEDKETDDGSR